MVEGSRIDNSPEAIGRRVSELRAQQGLTQRQATPPGAPRGRISLIENGKHTPTKHEIEALAEYLGCPAIFLSHGISEEEYEEMHIELAAASDAIYENRPQQAIEGFVAVINNPLSPSFPTILNDALYGRAEAREMSGDFQAAAHEFGLLVERLTPVDRGWGDAAAGAVRSLRRAGELERAIDFGRRAIETIGEWRQRPGAWGTAGLRIAAELLPAHVANNDQGAAIKVMHRMVERLGADQDADLRFTIYVNMARAHASFGELEGFMNNANLAFMTAGREGLSTPPALVNNYAQLLLDSGLPQAAQFALEALEQESRRGRTSSPDVAAARQALMEQARAVLQERGSQALSVAAPAFPTGLRARLSTRSTTSISTPPGHRSPTSGRTEDPGRG